MEIIKRIFLVIIIAIHTFCINAQTYESMEKLASKIVTEIDKGNNTRAFKHYQKAVSILKENQDSLHFYFPIVYAEDSNEEPIVSTMINHMVQIDSTLAEKWLYELSQLWQNHLELLRQYPEVDEFENLIHVNGPIGLLWAAECALADIEGLGNFRVPCKIFFDEALNIGIYVSEDFNDSVEDINFFLKCMAVYFDNIDDNLRACKAYIKYFNSIIDREDIDLEFEDDFQRAMLMYYLTCDVWNQSLSGKYRDDIEQVICEWADLRQNILDKYGDSFYNKMVNIFIKDRCVDYKLFGHYSFDCLCHLLNNIYESNIDADTIYSSFRQFINSINDPDILMEYIDYLMQCLDNNGMGAISFRFLDIVEEHCRNNGYNASYILETQTLSAQRALFYNDSERARNILGTYINNLDSLQERLTPNQYFKILYNVCGLYGYENDWERFKLYADITCKYIDQYRDEVKQSKKLLFFHSLAQYYDIHGDIMNKSKWIGRIIDDCKYIVGEKLPLELTSYPLCCAMIDYCYDQLINQERYQECIEILLLCIDYLKTTRRNSSEEGTAYIYLIKAAERLNNDELQRQYYEEFYKFLIRYFYQYSFSLSSNSRSALWQEHSEHLEYASQRTLINGSLIDVCYNFALLQKNHLLKYDNLVRNNIYASNDSLLIKAYEELMLAEDSNKQNAALLERRLMDLYSSHLEFRNSHRVYEWQDVQRQLGKNDLAVEFTVCYKEDTNSYAALLLKKDWDSPKMIELCEETELKRIMPSGARLYKENAEAYSCIWEKLEPYFKKGDNIYFAPHGLVHQLNIEVLCGADGKPMNKKCNLYRVSSTGNLAEDRDDLKYNSATLYGGLNYDTDTTSMLAINRNYVSTSSLQRRRLLDESVQTRTGWKYLPGTAEEVRNVGKILDRNKIKTTTYTDEVGTEESFKALSGNSTPIIHIATHGFYLEDKNARRVEIFRPFEENNTQTISPLKRSGLMFSGGQHAWLGREIPEGIDDGVLMAEEIAGMNLTGTDLLVLSACQTGLGEITNEGVEGLQRGFKIAGVNTIIMSLWEVSDLATETMMTTFYKYLTNGKSKREAFDLAVNKVREKTIKMEKSGELRKLHPQDPHLWIAEGHWAAFIMLD